MANSSVKQFLDSWVSQNVNNVPGLSEAADLDREVARLKRALIADAAVRGISANALETVVGNFEDYLTDAYEKVHDSELGFRDTERS
jgi:hypothetical protein